MAAYIAYRMVKRDNPKFVHLVLLRMKEESEMKRSMLERLKSSRPAIDLSGFAAGPKLQPQSAVSIVTDADRGDGLHHSNDPVPKKC